MLFSFSVFGVSSAGFGELEAGECLVDIVDEKTWRKSMFLRGLLREVELVGRWEFEEQRCQDESCLF